MTCTDHIAMLHSSTSLIHCDIMLTDCLGVPVGKTMFIALIGVVTLEVALVSRFWTRLFALVWSLSYILTFPWLVIIPLLYQVTTSSPVRATQ